MNGKSRRAGLVKSAADWPYQGEIVYIDRADPCSHRPVAGSVRGVRRTRVKRRRAGPSLRGTRKFKRLLLRGAATARSYALLALATRNNEMIVIAVASPGTRRHIANFHKLPVGHISRR